MSKNMGYIVRHLEPLLMPWMPKKSTDQSLSFGQRLAAIRKAAGFTQQELADAVSVSRRMIAYYEGQSEHPPTTLLPQIAAALAVSTDQLLGIQPVKKQNGKQPDTRLQRRLQQIQKLPTRERRQITQIIDTFIKAAQVQ